MEVLIVGAGAVGQVYGHHLARAGDRVSVLVRARHVAEARAGYRLHRMRRGRAPETTVFSPHRVITDEAEATGFDEIWLCVPTDALDDGWLGALATSQARLVYLQPGAQVRARLERFFAPERLTAGGIGMASWQTPLPGESSPEPGVGYYLTSFAPSLFTGPAAPDVVARLRRGGCPARRHPDARRAVALSSSLLLPQIVALETAGWSLAARNAVGALAARACREALALTARELGIRAPLSRPFLRGPVFRFVFWLARRLAPFDLERYLAYHFTKVRAQTRLLLERWIALAADRALPAPALGELHRRAFVEPS
jgi:2-dehydropantoate 2-reductase